MIIGAKPNLYCEAIEPFRGIALTHYVCRERERERERERFIIGDGNKCCYLATRGMRASTNV